MNNKVWIVVVIVVAAIAVVLLITHPWSPSSETLKIGAILPLSGDAAAYGKSARNGIEMAIEEANAAGGVDGRKVKVVYEDTQAKPAVGASAVQKLITADKVQAVIGGVVSSVTLAAAPIAERNRVVLLSPASSSPKITDAGDFVFRNAPSDTFEAGIMARHAFSDMRLRRVAVLYVNNDYGLGLKDVFSRQFISLGGAIVSALPFEQGTTDVRTQLAQLKTLSPEAVYMIGYRELGTVLKQATELGLETQFLSSVMFEDPEILKIAGAAAEGVVYTASAFDPASEDETSKLFAKKYHERYGVEPDVIAALSYDAAGILVSAMRRGGLEGPQIRDALYATRDYRGVLGPISFDENGDVVIQPVLKTVRNGEFVRLKDAAEGN